MNKQELRKELAAATQNVDNVEFYFDNEYHYGGNLGIRETDCNSSKDIEDALN